MWKGNHQLGCCLSPSLISSRKPLPPLTWPRFFKVDYRSTPCWHKAQFNSSDVNTCIGNNTAQFVLTFQFQFFLTRGSLLTMCGNHLTLFVCANPFKLNTRLVHIIYYALAPTHCTFIGMSLLSPSRSLRQLCTKLNPFVSILLQYFHCFGLFYPP